MIVSKWNQLLNNIYFCAFLYIIHNTFKHGFNDTLKALHDAVAWDVKMCFYLWHKFSACTVTYYIIYYIIILLIYCQVINSYYIILYYNCTVTLFQFIRSSTILWSPIILVLTMMYKLVLHTLACSHKWSFWSFLWYNKIVIC